MTLRENYTIHPYDYQDIAVLIIEGRFAFSTLVKPACIISTHYNRRFEGLLLVSIKLLTRSPSGVLK